MPIYEYGCESCGQVTEILQKLSDAPLKKCPHCSGKLKKLMSLNTFHLKGSGWYVTDYAGKKAPETKAEKESTETKSSDKPKETASKKKEDK
jgi:putative FmdB family regulatory protein